MLHAKYTEHFRQHIKDGPLGPKEQESYIDLEQIRIGGFLAFCKNYLAENRPAEITHQDMNFSIKLTNGDQFLVSPPAEEQIRGTMQSANAVPVTGASDMAALMRGIPDAARRRNLPMGVEDKSQDAPAQNMTQSQGTKEYGQ